MKNYEIIRKGNYVRWRNWKEFIEKETIFEKNNNILIAFVTYNNFSGAISLLKKCFEESKKFDLLILDNHSDIEHYREL
ncbi:MAG: hypothetical protein QXS41_00820 [Candidatus Woesearchaeota archaeon]